MEEGFYYPYSETKALISFAVTAKLISAFVFAYANCWFSDAAVQMSPQYFLVSILNFIIEPPRGKTNNVVSEQVRHKPACTATGDG